MELNDEMILKDDFGPKGFVTITDMKTGKILVKKSNMIVEEGRNTVLFSLLSSILKSDNLDLSASVDLSSFEGYKLTHLIFSADTSETIYNFNYSMINEAKNEYGALNPVVNIKYVKVLDGTNTTLEKYDGIHFRIKINAVLTIDSADDNYPISSLGLLMTKGNESIEPPKLFSRIRFDTINLTPDSRLNIVYYVYF